MRELRSLAILTAIHLGGFAFALAQPAPAPAPTQQTVGIKGTILIPYTPVPGPQGPKGDSIIGPMGPAGKDGRDGKDGTGTGSTSLPGIDASLPPWNVGSPGNDDAASLRAMLKTFQPLSRHTVRLPAGQLNFYRPLLVDKPVRFIGAGLGETNIWSIGHDAFIAGQVSDTTPDGKFTYGGNDSRPDLFGVLDKTLAPAPGSAFGFSTLGRSWAEDCGGGLAFGGYDRQAKAWDYWEGASGLTIEFAITAPPNQKGCIFSVGSPESSPYSYSLRFGDQPGVLWIPITLDGDPEGSWRIPTLAGFDSALPVNRGGAWFDFVTGESGGWMNGVVQPLGIQAGDLNIKGKHLRINDRDARFTIGPPIGQNPPIPTFTLAALAVSNQAVRVDAATDAGRYLKTAGVVGGFDPRRKEEGRLLTMLGGDAVFPGGNGSQPLGSFAVVFDALSNGNSLDGFDLSDCTLIGGGVRVAGVLDTRLTRIDAEGGRVGLGACRNFASYRISTQDCIFGGDHAAIQSYNSVLTHYSPKLTTGGLTSVYEVSCSSTWYDPFIAGFGGRQRRAFDLLSGDWAGQFTLHSPIVDAEGAPFLLEGIRAEPTVGVLRSITIRNGGIGGVLPSGYTVRLMAAKPNSQALPARVDIAGFGFAPGTAGSVYVESPEWYGTVDLRQCPGVNPPAGPGAAGVKVGP